MTMLPDIDAQSWEEYQRQELARQLQQKQDAFNLQGAIQEKISGVQSLFGSQPAEPAPAPSPSEPAPSPVEQTSAPPDLSRTGGWAQDAQTAVNGAPMQMSLEDINAAQQQQPEPEAPAPAPAAAPSPTPTPAASTSAPASPSPVSAPSSSGAPDWMGQILGKVSSAGGDIDKFVSSFNNRGGADMGADLMTGAAASGADLGQFGTDLPSVPQAAQATPQARAASGQPGTSSVSGVPDWLATLISKNAPGDLGSDPDFIRTVAAGAKAESGWDTNAVQKGGGGRGLFQFDLGGMGAPYRDNESVLLGDSGAQLQASQIVPLYAKAYQSAPAGLSGAEKASWVAAQAERPFDYQNAQSAARRNYASAYDQIGGGGDQNILQRAGSTVVGAGKAVLDKVSQFGDPQLTADEAYAACGPAAAVRFAQMYGRNPTLREATDLAKTVGWTSASGMAGLGSEKALMDKMGVATKVVGPDVNAMATEAQTGNPITISTPGHYFTADGYDPSTGAFHVGQSGLDLRGGSEWMTIAQMEQRMGKVQGALFADHPSVPAPSQADADTNPLSYLGRAKDAIASKWQDVTHDVNQPAAPSPTTNLAGNINPEVLGTSRLAPGSPGGPPDYTDYGRANAQAMAGQSSGLDQLAGSALEDFGRNGPIGFTRDRLQDLMRGDPTRPVEQARQELGKNIASSVPGDTPVLGGAAQLVGGIVGQPSALDSTDTLINLTNKYPNKNPNLAGVLPDFDSMTPEDRDKYTSAMMVIGSVASPLGDEGARGLAGKEGTAGKLDSNGTVLGKLGDVDSKFVLPEPSGLVDVQGNPLASSRVAQIVNPEGDLLSTVTRGQRNIRELGDLDIANITRTPEGAAVGLPEVTPEIQQRMPNLSHLATDMPEVQASLQRIAEENAPLVDRYRQGVITHQDLIESLAPKLGMTPEDFLNTRVGQAFNGEELLALRSAVVRKADEMQQLARQIETRGGYNQLNANEKVDFLRRALDASQLQTVGRGADTTAGRALNSLKINVDRMIADTVTGRNQAESIAGRVADNTERQGRIDALDKAVDDVRAERQRAVSQVTEDAGVTPVSEQATRATREAVNETSKETPLDRMTEVAKLDRDIIDARRRGDDARVDALTEQRDGIVEGVRSDLEQSLQAKLDAAAEADPPPAGMENVHRAQGRRLLGFLRSEVDAALNPTTQARTAGQLGDAVHKAVIKALQKAEGEQAAGSKKLTNQLDQIHQAYSDLEAYRAMSLEEKGSDFSQRAADREKAAANRAKALENRSAPEELLARLKEELAAERKHFAGSDRAWRRLSDAARKRELEAEEMATPRRLSDEERARVKLRQPEGRTASENPDIAARQRKAQADATKAWIDAQRRVAKQEAQALDALDKKAANREMYSRQQQRDIAAKILERLGGEKVTEPMITNLVKVMASGDPMETAKVIRGMQHVSAWDRFQILRYASMLAAFTTHTAQAAGNTLNLGIGMAAHPFAVGADILRTNLVGGGGRTRYMSEGPEMARGLMAGFHSGKGDALEILRSGINPSEVSRNWEAGTRPGFAMEQTALGERLPGAANAAINAAAEGPLRLLGAGDAVLRGMARGGYTRALAERQAIREGLNGDARALRRQDIMKHLEDYPELVAEAEQNAQRVVLQEHRSELNRLNLGNNPAGIALSILNPFVKTPYNILAQGVGLTPAGYLGAASSGVKSYLANRAFDRANLARDPDMVRYMADIERNKYNGQFADRFGRATLGSAMIYAAKALADGNYLTGATPEDPGERSTLPPAWKPHAFRVPLPQGDAYISYPNVAGPAGLPLSIGAAWSDAEKHDREGIDHQSLAGRMAGGVGRYMMDLSMLQSLSNWFDVIKEPDRKFENAIEGLSTQFGPANAFGRQLTRVLGDNPRDPHGILEALEATYPGVNGRVRAKLDSLGRPVQQTQTGIGALLSPAAYSVQPDDPVLKVLRDNDVGIGAAPSSYSGLAFTDDEREKIFPAQAGYYVKQLVQEVAADPEFQSPSTTDSERQAMLQYAVSQARQQAAADIFSQLSDDEIDRRYKTQQAKEAPFPIAR